MFIIIEFVILLFGALITISFLEGFISVEVVLFVLAVRIVAGTVSFVAFIVIQLLTSGFFIFNSAFFMFNYGPFMLLYMFLPFIGKFT